MMSENVLENESDQPGDAVNNDAAPVPISSKISLSSDSDSKVNNKPRASWYNPSTWHLRSNNEVANKTEEKPLSITSNDTEKGIDVSELVTKDMLAKSLTGVNTDVNSKISKLVTKDMLAATFEDMSVGLEKELESAHNIASKEMKAHIEKQLAKILPKIETTLQRELNKVSAECKARSNASDVQISLSNQRIFNLQQEQQEQKIDKETGIEALQTIDTSIQALQNNKLAEDGKRQILLERVSNIEARLDNQEQLQKVSEQNKTRENMSSSYTNNTLVASKSLLGTVVILATIFICVLTFLFSRTTETTRYVIKHFKKMPKHRNSLGAANVSLAMGLSKMSRKTSS